ncbi:MAG TPA: cation-efflux pump [Actinomycetota bacterium]|nr:cation-efflux pump [Actinomycetota bacterium]
MAAERGPTSSPDRVRKAASISVAITFAMLVAKAATAFATGSLALYSEAANSALDLGTTVLTFFAVRISSRPPDYDHPYGHGKAENLAALGQTVVLVGMAAYIAVHAILRLQTGRMQVVATWYAFAVVLGSMLVDAYRSVVLRRIAREERSPALEADALNFRADLLTSATALAGLAMVRLGVPAVDSVASLLIAGYVARTSIRLGRSSIDALMDRAPAGSTARIEQIISSVEGVEEVRRVRVRYVGGEAKTDVVIAISRLVPLERAHEVTEEIERRISAEEPGADVVVHVEPLADEKRVTQQVEAVALRQPVVAEVHNIGVTSHPEGDHITLHAKFPAEMELETAHSLAEQLESEIMSEIPGVTRVDTHIEPLLSNTTGEDVTSQHMLLGQWVKALAERQPEVHDCHEVMITRDGGGLSIVMHCEAQPELSVTAVHDASTRIEAATHARWPDVKKVTVHFEPVQ